MAGSFSLIGSQISHLDVTASTMDVAWDSARDGAPDGSVIIADHQSAGRGRHDRDWVSKQGQDILCSVVLRPRVALAGELLMIAALAVTDVANGYGIETGIKWPNDVQVAGKKLAGVIAESKTGPELGNSDGESDRISAVVGIGLNVNFDPSTHHDVAPNSTSLSVELGRDLDRQEVFEKLVSALDSRYSIILAGGTVVPAWRERLSTLCREVTIIGGVAGVSMDLHGLAHDVDSLGRLIVRDENGRDWPVSAGEVTVRDIS
ncbi:MAG: biotin--[acetyl-CoA-carboxylase] ligase [Dehalococcoidia bacterium]|nr:biotin--[acetyl-CoA-carboxylase] ligase [Dehalococcoidia bacterium]